MKKRIAGLTAFLFFLGMSLGEIGVQAGSGHSSTGVLLVKKDKDKDKELKEKAEKLEAKEKELNSKEEALNKKEEALKKREDNFKKRSKRFRRGVQQGAGPGFQQPPGAPAGFSPKTTIPKTTPPANRTTPTIPSTPTLATPPKQ